MKRKYVRMNDNKSYLSLGNLFNLIKGLASNKGSAMQPLLFSIIFNIGEVNATTVNNYCIGCRAIGLEYKNIYLNLKKEYENNKLIFIDIVLGLLSVLDERIYQSNSETLAIINKSKSLKKLNQKLLLLSSGDLHLSKEYICKQEELINKDNQYEAIINFLIYIVLENNQPIFIQPLTTNINQKELDEYLSIKLYEGFSYITSLKELGKKGNKYANAELGSLEFSAYITGQTDYEVCYEYYLLSALKNHPKGCFMVANLILTKRVKKAFETAWQYLNKAIVLGSISALNTMGKCLLEGLTPDKKINEKKAITYFKMASESGYVYAYNNLGLIYERKNNIEEALKYYKISADLGESWALNKVGEYYRKKGDLGRAYLYYLKSSEAPINERNYYSYYNLATYYYLNGFKDLNIQKDSKLANKLLKIAKEKGIK